MLPSTVHVTMHMPGSTTQWRMGRTLKNCVFAEQNPLEYSNMLAATQNCTCDTNMVPVIPMKPFSTRTYILVHAGTSVIDAMSKLVEEWVHYGRSPLGSYGEQLPCDSSPGAGLRRGPDWQCTHALALLSRAVWSAHMHLFGYEEPLGVHACAGLGMEICFVLHMCVGCGFESHGVGVHAGAAAGLIWQGSSAGPG